MSNRFNQTKKTEHKIDLFILKCTQYEAVLLIERELQKKLHHNWSDTNKIRKSTAKDSVAGRRYILVISVCLLLEVLLVNLQRRRLSIYTTACLTCNKRERNLRRNVTNGVNISLICGTEIRTLSLKGTTKKLCP